MSILRNIAAASAIVGLFGIAMTNAVGQSGPQVPVVKEAPVPAGTYQQLTTKELVALSTMALVDPNLGDKTAVVYVHRLSKDADVSKVADELATKLAAGSVRLLRVPKDEEGKQGVRFTLPPNQNGVSQLKYLAQRNDEEIGLVSFDKYISASVDTTPSKWISWNATSSTVSK